ncbi:MAG: hypothetical protein F7C07_03655 [Desulfurococcales archaeon]|nr:hypothetical protein [Desulfurococcales archaeon]
MGSEESLELKCLEDVVEVDRLSLIEARSVLDLSEANMADLLLYSGEGKEVYARVFVSVDCLLLVYMVVRACGEASGDLLRLASEAPEVTRISMENGCVEAMVPPEPRGRVSSFLEKAGIKNNLEVKAYRILEESVIHGGHQVQG